MRNQEGFSAGISRENGVREKLRKNAGLATAAAIVAVTGVAAGAYFFPRGQKVEIPVVIATATASAAAGTPKPADTPRPAATARPADTATATFVVPSPTPGQEATATFVVKTPTATAVEPTKAADTATPRPTERPAFTYLSLRPGESFEASAGDIVKGDVAVNGQEKHDGLQHTGLIVDMQQPGSIYALWGADVIRNIELARRDEILAQLKEEMYRTGCVGGCQIVDVVTHPGGRQGQRPVNTATAVPTATATRTPDATATVVPTATATRTPDATATVVRTPEAPTFIHRSVNPGGITVVEANSIIAGDVKNVTANKALFDNVADTGLVTITGNTITVEFPWGGTVSRSTDATYQQVLEESRKAAIKMVINGCGTGTGCKEVAIKNDNGDTIETVRKQ